MATAPEGWSDFTGGGSNPDACGEGPPVITPSALELRCLLGFQSINLVITGGIPPFTWETTEGLVIVTGLRTASITIHEDPDPDDPDFIAFFKPHVYSFFFFCESQPDCAGPELRVTLSNDVRLRAFDCLGIYIPNTTFGGVLDNLYPDYALAPYAHPIGDNVADRSCTLSVSYGGTPTGAGDTLSDDTHWTTSSNRCVTNQGTALVSAAVHTAGKNAIHGTVHAAAVAWSGSKFLPVQSCTLGVPPTDDTDFDNYIDVRTQAMIDSPCCLAEPGSNIVVTVTDAAGNQDVVVIPVI